MHYNCMQLAPMAGIETVREWHGRVYAIRIINTAVNKMAVDGSNIVSHKIDIRVRERREDGSFSLRGDRIYTQIYWIGLVVGMYRVAKEIRPM